LERARKVRELHSLMDKGQFVGNKRKQRTVALGVDTTTPIEDIDFNTSRFPLRDKQIHVDPEVMASPTGRHPTPEPRKRAGMLPTQPQRPTAPEPPKPTGWDQEIGM
jgi:hypothetical protein